MSLSGTEAAMTLFCTLPEYENSATAQTVPAQTKGNPNFRRLLFMLDPLPSAPVLGDAAQQVPWSWNGTAKARHALVRVAGPRVRRPRHQRRPYGDAPGATALSGDDRQNGSQGAGRGLRNGGRLCAPTRSATQTRSGTAHTSVRKPGSGAERAVDLLKALLLQRVTCHLERSRHRSR